VLFCHITSHVETDADQDLLGKKGGGGWPYIVVMDADGNVLSVHEPESRETFRKTAGFRATVADARATANKLEELRKAAKGGDKDAAADLLGLQIELAHLDAAGAKKQLAAIRGLPKERFSELDRKVVALEVNEIQTSATEDEATHYAAGKKFAAMVEDDRIPPDDEALYFWYFVSVYAEKEKDADLYGKALAGMRKHERQIRASFLEQMEKTLEKLRDGR
jgi:hypothetical protein